MVELNLLPEEEVKEATAERVKRKAITYSIVGLIITAVVSVIVFGYWIMLSQQENQLAKRINLLSNDVQGLSQTESLVRVLKNKLAAMVTIQGKTQNFAELLTDVGQIVPQGVTLSDMTLSDQNIITLTGTAVSATEFSRLVNNLLSPNTGLKSSFTAVTVESLTRDDKGIYNFTISAKLKAL